MALTGFDPELVTSSISKIQNAYNELMAAIGTDMQNQFVNGMQDKWACSDAQTFFNNFKTTVDSLITNSNNTFESVVNAMNSAAKAWAEQTGSTWSAKQFSRNDVKMDITGIKENIGGVRGVDLQATAVSDKLPTIAEAAGRALDNSKSAVINCGFVGGTSEADLVNSLEQIKTSINNAVSQISNDCKKAIETTTQNYSTLEVSVSDAFSSN